MEEQNITPKDEACMSDGTCGRPNCCGGHGAPAFEEEEDEVSGNEAPQAPAQPGNPFANLDTDTQAKIQELQQLEQTFQQLMMQKNAFNMELNETDLILSEVENADGEVMRIVGNQVVIKSSKEKILEEMKRKHELLTKRMEDINGQEKEFSEKMESLRNDVLAKIQG